MLQILAWAAGIYLAWWAVHRLGAWMASESSPAEAAGGNAGMPPRDDPPPDGTPQVRLTARKDDRTGQVRYDVEFRGRVPISRPATVAVITHAIDSAAGMPLISLREEFQEPETYVFRFQCRLGDLQPNQGWTDWVRVGAFHPDWMIGPVGGRRRLEVVVRFIDVRNGRRVPLWREVEHHVDGILWVSRPMVLEHEFEDRGYEELEEDRLDLLEKSVQVAVCVAMRDGVLDSEREVIIKDWMRESVELEDEEDQPALKRRLNSAFKAAHEESSDGLLGLDDLLEGLGDVWYTAGKHRLVELVVDVLVADGTATGVELSMITQVTDALGLGADESARARDRALIRLDPAGLDDSSLDLVVGIKPDWGRDAIHAHLRTEFQKWNGRLTSLPEGREREIAQRMLELVAEARKRHA